MPKKYLLQCLFITVLTVNMVLLPSTANAQEESAAYQKNKPVFEPNKAILISTAYTAQFPFGKMADRFGFNSQMGLQVHYKMNKNWMIGLDGGFIFGNVVRETFVLDKISTFNGRHISQNGDLQTVTPQMLGFNIKFQEAKIIPFSVKYPDAGLLLITGVGFLQHKISINVRENILPQLSKTYRKGYDRLTNGPSISQFVGGIFMQRKKLYSFYAGVQYDIAFTANRRNFDFYEMRKLSGGQVDMMLGVKIGWILPVFLEASEKEFFYY